MTVVVPPQQLHRRWRRALLATVLDGRAFFLKFFGVLNEDFGIEGRELNAAMRLGYGWLGGEVWPWLDSEEKRMKGSSGFQHPNRPRQPIETRLLWHASRDSWGPQLPVFRVARTEEGVLREGVPQPLAHWRAGPAPHVSHQGQQQGISFRVKMGEMWEPSSSMNSSVS